jgi:hypothetical protein
MRAGEDTLYRIRCSRSLTLCNRKHISVIKFVGGLRWGTIVPRIGANQHFGGAQNEAGTGLHAREVGGPG